MSNKTLSNFIDNSMLIIGFASTLAGIALVGTGIYEHSSHHKLFENINLHLPSPIELFIENMCGLPAIPKINSGLPILIFGNLLTISIVNKKNKANLKP